VGQRTIAWNIFQEVEYDSLKMFRHTFDQGNEEMKCPKCETEMKTGSFAVEGTWARFIFLVGMSWQSLWFRPDDRSPGQEKKWLILDSNDSRRGFLCPQCGTSVLVR